MKGLLYIAGLLLALACVCVITCPDRNAHSEALRDLLNDILMSEVSAGAETGDDKGIAALVTAVGTEFGGRVIDNLLKVDNYFVFSVGRIPYDGSLHVVSIGVMNHIFTVSQEQVAEKAGNLFL